MAISTPRQREILEILKRKCPAAAQRYEGWDKPSYSTEAVADYAIRVFILSLMGFPDYEMYEELFYKPFDSLSEWEQEGIKMYYDKWGVKDINDNQIDR